jgi:Domain of unknown function (DUF2341)
MPSTLSDFSKRVKKMAPQVGVDSVSNPSVIYDIQGGLKYSRTITIDSIAGSISTTINITNAGTGYTIAPTVNIALPVQPKVQATATVTVVAGVVTAITMTNQGMGYYTTPNFQIDSSFSGANAVVQPVIGTGANLGKITGFNIISGGTGYAPTCNLVIAAPDEWASTGATATATITSGQVTSITVTNVGSGYLVAPIITFTGVGGTGATATATLAVIAALQIPIQLDTKALYAADKMGFNSNDIRIYDGATELPIWVQHPNTTYTNIWVKLTNYQPGTSKNITMQYGNSAYSSVSNKTNVGFGSFESYDLKAWLNQDQVETFRSTFYQKVKRAKNQAPRINAVDFYPDTISDFYQGVDDNFCPKFGFYTQNNIPVYTFDGGQWLENLNNVTQTGGRKFYQAFFVEKRKSTNRMYPLADNNNVLTTNDTLNAGYYSNTVPTLDQGNNFIGQTIPAYTALNERARVWQTGMDTGGKFLRINGTLNDSNSNNVGLINPRPLRIGYAQYGNYYFIGDIAEVIFFTADSTTTFNFDKVLVERYLNFKYRIFGPLPTVNIGSETTNSTGFTYTKYNPIILSATNKASLTEKFYGIALQNQSIKISNFFQKGILPGNALEKWSTSTWDGQRQGRKLFATTTMQYDSVKIFRLDTDNTTNRANLGFYNLKNKIIPTQFYPSSNNDFIHQQLYVEDNSKIDQANSFIEFSGNNTIPNSSFENGILPWVNGGMPTFQISNSQSRSGTKSLQLTNNGTGFPSCSIPINYPVVGGQVYNYSAYLKTTTVHTGGANGNVLRLYLFWYDSTNTYISENTVVAQDLTTATLNWSRIAGNVTAPANAAFVKLSIYMYSSGTVFVDDIDFAVGNTPPVYQSFFSPLNKNVNTLVNNLYNNVKIKKSDFTNLGGGIWDDSSYNLHFGIKTITGGQNTFHRQYRLVKSPTSLNSDFATTDPLYISNFASGDDGASYFEQKIIDGRITKQSTSNTEIEFSGQNYLTLTNDHTMKYVGAYPNRKYNGKQLYSPVLQYYGADGFKVLMKYFLGLLYPQTIINFDLGEFEGNTNIVNYFNPALFVYRNYTQVRHFIKDFLTTILGVIVWNADGSITVCAGSKYLTKNTADYILPQHMIDNFKSIVYDEDYIVNRVRIVYWDRSTYDGLIFYPGLSKRYRILEFLNGSITLKPGQNQVEFLQDKFTLPEAGLFDNLTLGGFNCTQTSGGANNNAGIGLQSYYITENGSLQAILYNANNFDTYLKEMSFDCDIIAYKQAEEEEIIEDVPSISKYGLHEILIDNKILGYGKYSWPAGQSDLRLYYQNLIDELKNPTRVFEFDIQFYPGLNISNTVQFLSDENELILGCIIKMYTYYTNGKYTQTLTVREKNKP